jgi:hypothetical protein
MPFPARSWPNVLVVAARAVVQSGIAPRPLTSAGHRPFQENLCPHSDRAGQPDDFFELGLLGPVEIRDDLGGLKPSARRPRVRQDGARYEVAWFSASSTAVSSSSRKSRNRKRRCPELRPLPPRRRMARSPSSSRTRFASVRNRNLTSNLMVLESVNIEIGLPSAASVRFRRERAEPDAPISRPRRNFLQPVRAPRAFLRCFVCTPGQTKTPPSRGFREIAGAGFEPATFGL